MDTPFIFIIAFNNVFIFDEKKFFNYIEIFIKIWVGYLVDGGKTCLKAVEKFWLQTAFALIVVSILI